MSSRSLRLEPFAFQSFQISSETFLEPSARGVKILLVLLLTASGDKWWSWTRGFGAKASRTSGIWSQTGSWIPAKGSGTPSGITGWAFRLPSSLEYRDLSKLSGKRSWRFSCWLIEGCLVFGSRHVPLKPRVSQSTLHRYHHHCSPQNPLGLWAMLRPATNAAEKQWHRSQQGWCRLGQLWLPAPGLFGEIIFTLYQIILYHMCPIQETWDLVRNRIIDAYSTQIQAGNFQLTNHFLFTETLRP